MNHEQIIHDATTWAKAYMGTNINVPRLNSLLLGYVMGAQIDQVAKQEILDKLFSLEKSGYHHKRG